jgi:hypothetical protein
VIFIAAKIVLTLDFVQERAPVSRSTIPLFVCTESCQPGSLALAAIFLSCFAARSLRRFVFVHGLLLLCEFSVDLWSSDFLRSWSSFTAATIFSSLAQVTQQGQ